MPNSQAGAWELAQIIKLKLFKEFKNSRNMPVLWHHHSYVFDR